MSRPLRVLLLESHEITEERLREVWRLLPIAWRGSGPRSLHSVTTALPQSYVSLTRTSGRTWSLRDEQAPASGSRCATRSSTPGGARASPCRSCSPSTRDWCAGRCGAAEG